MKAAHRESPPPSAVFPLITAYMTSQVIYVAARLGIAELLQDGAKSGNELARAMGTLNALRRGEPTAPPVPPGPASGRAAPAPGP